MGKAPEGCSFRKQGGEYCPDKSRKCKGLVGVNEWQDGDFWTVTFPVSLCLFVSFITFIETWSLNLHVGGIWRWCPRRQLGLERVMLGEALCDETCREREGLGLVFPSCLTLWYLLSHYSTGQGLHWMLIRCPCHFLGPPSPQNCQLNEHPFLVNFPGLCI